MDLQQRDAISPELVVSDTTRARIQRGWSANTQRAYSRALDRYTLWCRANGRTPIPGTAQTLAEHVSHLCDTGLAPSSIEQAIAAVRFAHRMAGHADLPDMTAARLVLRAHRRDRAAEGKRSRQAPPITLDALRRMITATVPETAIGLRDRALLVLGFSLMGRRSELAALRIEDVQETEDGLLVTIRWSKTDQDARGETVAIPRGSHPETDPVRVLQAYLNALAAQGITTGPLFRSVNRWGHLRASISEEGINRVIKCMARRGDLPNAGTYSAHSLRAGGATASYKAGAPVSVIARHGRWAESSPVVLSYIRAVDKWTDNPLRGIGL